MNELSSVTEYLKEYKGETIKLMEICGTHTASIAKDGIRSVISPKIELVSGPGCPVCVCSSSYIDKLCEISKTDGSCVAAFGDMIKAPGSKGSLQEAKAEGGRVIMLYSPFDLLKIAAENPETKYVFAAVGFETTAPVYALLIERALELNIKNIKLLTAIKIMPPVLEWLLKQETDISGFIAPGHVSVITGTGIYKPLAEKSGVPFAVAGFSSEQILKAIYLLLKTQGEKKVLNIYTSAVKPEGNEKAREKIYKYFETGAAYWRGIGEIENSGLYLKKEFADFDAKSKDIYESAAFEKGCRCGDILTGRITPLQCPFFGKACTPQTPKGACMVSGEGACGIWFENREMNL